MSNLIPGYAIHGVSAEFRDLATNNTFVTDCAAGAPHYRKVNELHAVTAGGGADTICFDPCALVYQTIRVHREAAPKVRGATDTCTEFPAAQLATAEPAAFRPNENIQLAILPGIEHTANILEHDGDNRWAVAATINGQRFSFIVFADQIVKQREWVVTGFKYIGKAGDGTLAIEPLVESFSGFSPQEAIDKATSLTSGLYVVSVVERAGVTEAHYILNAALESVTL